MKYSAPYIIRTIIIIVVLLAMFHLLKPTNPIVELADDAVCEYLDADMCQDIKDIEAEEGL